MIGNMRIWTKELAELATQNIVRYKENAKVLNNHIQQICDTQKSYRSIKNPSFTQ